MRSAQLYRERKLSVGLITGQMQDFPSWKGKGVDVLEQPACSDLFAQYTVKGAEEWGESLHHRCLAPVGGHVVPTLCLPSNGKDLYNLRLIK